MTRNVLILLALGLFLHNSQSFATADSAVLQGFGGAGRAGIPKESLFSNPAGAAMLTDSTSFLNFVKPNIPDFNAGGRAYNVGIYDGGQPDWKGGFAYTRSARAVLKDGAQDYDDRSELRFTIARPVTDSILMGAQVRYTKVKIRGDETKFFQGDVGAILPLSPELRAGITYENISRRPGELPPTLGAGIHYLLGLGLETYLDATRQMGGLHAGDKGWNAGAQVPLPGGLVGRAGKFQDGVRRLKGWTVGGGWGGPRISVDYAMRTAGTKNRERDHLFGMNISF
ncbi:MAG: hypothetical protein ACXWQO_01025 [Bdellovibrionota bacterium]